MSLDSRPDHEEGTTSRRSTVVVVDVGPPTASSDDEVAAIDVVTDGSTVVDSLVQAMTISNRTDNPTTLTTSALSHDPAPIDRRHHTETSRPSTTRAESYDHSVPGKVMTVMLLAMVLMSCTSGSSGQPIPSIDEGDAASLRARAVWRACTAVVCPGAPILVDASIPGEVRVELSQFTDEIRYVTRAEVEDMGPQGERLPDGATLFDATLVRPTGRPDVVGVDVSISRGLGDFLGRTYLFPWDGLEWADASADAVGVTVTSAVS